MTVPPLTELGEQLLVQHALTRLLRAPRQYLQGWPRRYRQFRRAMQAQGSWFSVTEFPAQQISPLETDAILLGMLRAANRMRDDGILIGRLGSRRPQLVDDVEQLQRHQVLVDEATDFWPLQLACMAELTSARTGSVFACGDFNQRLTAEGSGSEDQLRWAIDGLNMQRVNTAYRQSRHLTAFAAALAPDRTSPDLLKYAEHEGVPPVLGLGLEQFETIAAWLRDRICEVERLTGELPSVAILVHSREELAPLASALNEALQDMNLRAVACPDGQALGSDGDVRLFEAQHIKGLQFEAVFFVGVDQLALREPNLFDRYLYVGATRAATYLGLTCAESDVPEKLSLLGSQMVTDWTM